MIKEIKERLDTVKVEKFKTELLKAVDNVDENLDIKVFAKVVAEILEEEYGEHNYEAFFKILKDYKICWGIECLFLFTEL